jgi:hypothetical protein
MTKEKAKELSKILLAYSQGKTIQIKMLSGCIFGSRLIIADEWVDLPNDNACIVSNPTDEKYYQYRVKPEPKLVPFTFEDRELFKNLWFKVKSSGALIRPLRIDKDGLSFSSQALDFICYSHLLSGFELEDGSPCGKYIE